MASNKADATVGVISFKTPKQALLMVVKVGIAKCNNPIWETVLLGLMGGFYVGFGGLVALIAAGGMTGAGSIGAANPSIPKLVFAVTFPVALLLIILAGAELFTGNCMYMPVALFERRISLTQMFKNWFLVYFSNFAGCVLFAYFLGYLTELVRPEPYHSYLISLTTHKIDQTWGVNFLRGIGANWMVCIAMFGQLAANDFAGKILIMWPPIFTFAATGFEHCVANMFTLHLGLMEGAPNSWGELLWFNLVPSTLGNIFGGFTFVATAEWLAYGLPYFGDAAKEVQPKPGPKRQQSKSLVLGGSGVAIPLQEVNRKAEQAVVQSRQDAYEFDEYKVVGDPEPRPPLANSDSLHRAVTAAAANGNNVLVIQHVHKHYIMQGAGGAAGAVDGMSVVSRAHE